MTAGPATWSQETDFEAGDTSGFDSVVQNGSSTFTATEAAALAGIYGASVVLDATPAAAYGSFTGPTADTIMSCEFRIDPNSLSMDNTEITLVLLGTGGAGTTLTVRLRIDSGDYGLQPTYYDDTPTQITGVTQTITDAPHLVTMLWRASAAPGADNGEVLFFIDGVLMEHITGIDNDTHNVDTLLFGASAFGGTPGPGTYYLDDCRWSDVDYWLQLQKFYIWTASFRASDREDAYHAGSDEKRSRA